jgi:putative DNA-invertase from lambdoid prophage Rac
MFVYGGKLPLHNWRKNSHFCYGIAMAKQSDIPATTATVRRRALCYSRVSSTRQLEEGESLAAQRAKLEALCVLNDLDLHEVYEEQAVSGAKPFTLRPQGSRLWADARRGDVIVVLKMDRFSRSPSDALNMLTACRERGIGLILADMGTGDVTKGAVATMLVGILSCVSGFERERNGERVAEVKSMLKAQGRFGGGAVPFGYKLVVRDGEKFIEPDTALQVRVLDLHRRGFSSRMIVAELAKDGVPSTFVTICRFLREHASRAA